MKAYRPLSFEDFHGQSGVTTNLKIAVSSSIKRGAPVPHTLLTGPPGLGKTTLAGVIANERDVPVTYLNGASVEKAKDIVPSLVSDDDNRIIFVDEIHRLKPEIEEFLYTAMEDNYITIVPEGGQDPLRLDISPFTLIGATTREGQLTGPMRNRFKFVERFNLYSVDDMKQVIEWQRHQIEDDCDIDFIDDTLSMIIPFCRGTPRESLRILEAARDTVLAVDGSSGNVKYDDMLFTLERLGYIAHSELGLSQLDLKYMEVLRTGAKGIRHISEVLREDAGTLESVIEPWLLQNGIIELTSRGRSLTDIGKKAINEEA